MKTLRSRSWVAPLVLGVVMLLAMALLIFREPLLNRTAEYLVERDRVALQRHIGKPLPSDVWVIRGNDPEPIGLDGVFQGRGLLVVYDEPCPPCLAAVNQIRAAHSPRRDDASHWPPIFFLSQSPASLPPAGIPASRLLDARPDAGRHWIFSSASPIFYMIDADRRIETVQVGYDHRGLAAWLDELLSDTGASWIER